MPIHFDSVFVTATGLWMPGEPVDNEALDRYIAPLNSKSARIKRRILAENGIQSRYYGIDPDGAVLHSTASMAAHAVEHCLAASEIGLRDLTLLCAGTSVADLALPGFANMVQGELHAPPLQTSSHQGVCTAGVAALQHAASALELSDSGYAVVVASEFPSRLFRRSRFAPRGYDIDFDSHFLRWMLSDGAGACLLSKQPRASGVSLRLRWIHSRSFSGDLPVCMQIGQPHGENRKHYLDYPSLAEAEADGAFLLRQDIRLLPHLFELGIHECIELVRQEAYRPDRVDHFLCHYSSQKFAGVLQDLFAKADVSIPAERWYSNLRTRGNTGAASIFIKLADFVRERELVPGQRILCLIPESGRFTIALMMLEVVAARSDAPQTQTFEIAPPHDPANASSPMLGSLLRDLASVWHDFRSRAWRTDLIRKMTTRQFTPADYLKWMECWIPQVREGSRWMRAAADRLDERHVRLSELIKKHAREEQFDYDILFQDYRTAGGTIENIDALRRNPGGEALNAYMYALANQPNPVGLLGAIYIIEGTGQRIVPALLPLLRQQLDLPERAFRFLTYHGENDVSHLARWLNAVEMVLELDPDCGMHILSVARATAELYLLQMKHAI